MQCLFIQRSTFLDLCERYPKTRENLQKIAFIRHRHFSRIRRATRYLDEVDVSPAKERFLAFKNSRNEIDEENIHQQIELSDSSCIVIAAEESCISREILHKSRKRHYLRNISKLWLKMVFVWF